MRGVQDSLDPHTGSWRCQPVPLNFRLGELTLFSPRLPLYVCTRHLTELPEDWEDPPEPLADLPTGTEGILFRSHPTRILLRRLRWISGTIRYVPSQYERFYVDLDRSTEEYWKTFSSKSRSTLKRKMRRFAEFSGGDIHWREYRWVREMEEFYANARRVSAMTYQEKLLNAGLPDSASFRKKMLELAERDQVRGYLLYQKEKPVAYLYTPITDETARYEYLGFDPEYARWSPGIILQWLVLEKLLDDQGVRTFDFLEGETASKRLFATGSQRCADIYFFKPSLKNILLVISHSMLDSLSAFLGVVLDRLRLKSRVKELIRGK